MTGIVLAIGSVAALFGITMLVHFFGKRFDLSSESQRKLVHVAVGLHAIALPHILDRRSFLVFAILAAAALLALRSDRLRSGIGGSVHSVKRKSWGDLLFLLAVAVLFVRAPGDPLLYTLPIAVLTLSDAAAALVGSRYGAHRFGTGDRIKSVEGSLVFFLVTWIICVAILLQFTAIPRENITWLAFFVAGFATIIEADSWQGLDNVFVPLAVHTMCMVWGESPSATLGMAATVWTGLFFVAQFGAGYVGITPHQARAGLVAVFLSAATIEWPAAIFPLGALAMHLASINPSENSATPDFALLLVIVGVFWLFMGHLTGSDATAYYAACFAAVICAFAVRAVADKTLPVQLLVGVVTILIVVGLHHYSLNSGITLLATLNCTAVLLACVIRPSVIFKPSQNWRAGAAALPVLVVGYLQGVLA